MSLQIKVISAQLSHDTETFSNMDPYCILQLGSSRQRTKTKQQAGKKPVWNQTFRFNVPNNDLKVIVMDEDTMSDDLVGEGEINVSKFRANSSEQDQIVQLLYKGRTAGKVMLRISGQGANNTGGNKNIVDNLWGQSINNQSFGAQNNQWGTTQQNNNQWGQSNPYGTQQNNNQWGQPNPYGAQQNANQFGQSNPYGTQQNANQFGQSNPYGTQPNTNQFGQTNPYGTQQNANQFGQSNPYGTQQNANQFGQSNTNQFGQGQQSPWGSPNNQYNQQPQLNNPQGQGNLNQWGNQGSGWGNKGNSGWGNSNPTNPTNVNLNQPNLYPDIPVEPKINPLDIIGQTLGSVGLSPSNPPNNYGNFGSNNPPVNPYSPPVNPYNAPPNNPGINPMSFTVLQGMQGLIKNQTNNSGPKNPYQL